MKESDVSIHTWYKGHVSHDWCLCMAQTLTKAKLCLSELNLPLKGSACLVVHPWLLLIKDKCEPSQMRWSHGPKSATKRLMAGDTVANYLLVELCCE